MIVYTVRNQHENHLRIFSTREKAISYATGVRIFGVSRRVADDFVITDYEDGDTSVCRNDGLTFWIRKEMVE